MITRDYQCQTCEGTREYLEQRDSPTSRPCEEEDCGGLSERIFSAPNVHTSKRSVDNGNHSPYVKVIEIGCIVERTSPEENSRNWN